MRGVLPIAPVKASAMPCDLETWAWYEVMSAGEALCEEELAMARAAVLVVSRRIELRMGLTAMSRLREAQQLCSELPMTSVLRTAVVHVYRNQPHGIFCGLLENNYCIIPMPTFEMPFGCIF
jgi:hypothetical protein